jgi:hypothetical protein
VVSRPDLELPYREGGSPMFNRRIIHWPRAIEALSASTRRRAIAVAVVPVLFGVVGTTGPAHSRDSGLAGCTAVAGARQLTASDYEKIGVQFADSRWPDLRSSGVTYAEIAIALLNSHAYGGETVWFYERLADACAVHGRALPFWPA